ncbi:hypothetical protein [Rhizobium sp. NRK18]|jgi:hypothetical protein|uniref:hypothetical protein n=1 Tax=Rhizobium sp. NRK18 TaxID=2964667 RepID=UPI0021C3665E|nr:hypothetical protein [Rhizobium sp. NRK18]MCQ2005354.1 hypothetical protein [Rhizobium sp. NRK18]
MRKCPYSAEREKIIAEAISPIATELRMIEVANLVAYLHLECYGNLSDLVSSAAELYFHPGTVNLGVGGDYKMDWNSVPEVTLDLEIKAAGVTAYTRLCLTDKLAGVELTHIAFQSPAADPHLNTMFLKKALNDCKFVKSAEPPPQAIAC